jgi:uncharacterized protein YggL (DUF469 family)
MKKRLRKKLRLNEFREMGFLLGYRYAADKSESDRYELLENFLEKAIETNGLLCIGFPKETEDNQFEAFVMVDEPRGSVNEEQRSAVMDWLKAEGEISAYHASPLMDAWYSDFSGDHVADWQTK